MSTEHEQELEKEIERLDAEVHQLRMALIEMANGALRHKAEVDRLKSLSNSYRTALARIAAQKDLPQPMAFNTAIIIAELELEHEH